MNSFFSLEGPLISFLDKCGRVILLNILWLLTSLPLITIVSSTSAFYYGITKTIRHERSKAAKEFFNSFKRVLKSSLLVSIAFGLLFLVLVFDIYVYMKKASRSSVINMNICIILLILITIIFIFVSAVYSRFDFKRNEIIKFSAFLTFKHLPYSVLILIVTGVMIITIAAIPVTILFMPGLACVLISIFMEKIFKQYMPKPLEGEEEWYDE